VAIATVVAAVIAGLISVVALTLTKEQKTSEFRQAWIDGLRSDLADYLAAFSKHNNKQSRRHWNILPPCCASHFQTTNYPVALGAWA